MNSVNLIGRIVADLELKETNTGHLLKFSIAIQKPIVNGGADFVPCAAFNKNAEIISKNLKKGDQVGLQGSLSSSSYTDKDGNKRNTLELNISKITFLNNKDNKKESVDPGLKAPNDNTEQTESNGDADFIF